jgi:hypothetical protein
MYISLTLEKRAGVYITHAGEEGGGVAVAEGIEEGADR